MSETVHNVRDGRHGWIGSWEIEPLAYDELTDADIGRTVIYRDHVRAEAGTLTSWRAGLGFARYSRGDTSAAAHDLMCPHDARLDGYHRGYSDRTDAGDRLGDTLGDGAIEMSDRTKVLDIADKATALAEDSLAGIDRVMAAWPAAFKAIMWETIADIATRRATEAKESSK